MMSLTDFIDALPNAMPRKARKLILEGDLLSRDERADIHRRESMFDFVLNVGPDAARAVLAAYQAERLPMKKGAKPEAAPRADAYLATSNELRRQIGEKRRRAAAVKDPSVVTEGDLSDHRLLDSVFMPTTVLARAPLRWPASRFTSSSPDTRRTAARTPDGEFASTGSARTGWRGHPM